MLLKYVFDQSQSVIAFVSNVLGNNGYPSDVVRSVICAEMTQFKKLKLAGPEKSHVYLRLPLIGVRLALTAKP